MTEIDGKILVAVVGIAGVVVLEAAALFNGINGTYLSIAVGAITTIVGYVYGFKKGQEA